VLTKTKNRLDTVISTLEKENNALKNRITALKNDNFYVEKYALEEYGLAKPLSVAFLRHMHQLH